MKTLEQAWDIIETLNRDAYDYSLDWWLEADEVQDNGDDELAEDLRCSASEEQAEYFRDSYDDLTEEDKEVIKYWIQHDKDFREQFQTYYGDHFE